jgi:transposase
MKVYVGLDVHSKKIVYAVLDQEGKVVKQGEVETSREGLRKLVREARLKKGTEVAMETGVQAFWVVEELFELGMEPVVINAHEVRSRARRRNQKSDRRDALELADGLRRGIYESRVFVPDKKLALLRQALSRRRHFLKVSTMEINAARFLLRQRAIEFERTLSSEAIWKELLSDSRVKAIRHHLELHAEMWLLARKNIAELEQELKEICRSFKKELKLLMTVPGVGLITAATFLAVVGRPQRFSDSGKLSSYLGLVPSSYDSGETVRRGRLTKSGSAAVRATLCEAAHHAARTTHPLHPYWNRLIVRMGYRKAVIAVARRLACIMYRMWLEGEEFQVKKLNVVFKPEEKKRLIFYQLKKEGTNDG